MIDELDWVKSLRPPAPPASSDARRRRSRSSSGDRTELAKTNVRVAEPQVASGIGRDEPRRKYRPTSSTRRSSQRGLSLGLSWLMLTAAAIVALVIAGGVLVLVRHGSTGAGGFTGSGPRGLILDRNGAALVKNRVEYDLQINPGEVPASAAARANEYRLLFGTRYTRRLSRCDATGQRTQRPTSPECELAARHGHAGWTTLATDVAPRVRTFVADHKPSSQA